MIRLGGFKNPNELVDQELYIEKVTFKDGTCLHGVIAVLYDPFLIITAYELKKGAWPPQQCNDWYNLDEIKDLHNVELNLIEFGGDD